MANIWYIHPYAGGPGIGRYDRPYHLACYWRKKNHKPVIICPNYHHLLDQEKLPGTTKIDDATYEFIASKMYKGNGFGRMKHMLFFGYKLLREYTLLVKLHGVPDVIISSSPHPYTVLAAYILAQRSKARFIFEVRDLWPLSLTELAGLKKYHPLICFTAFFERLAYRKADNVVSLLPNTLDYMVSRGLKPKKWSYIPNGVKKDISLDHELSSSCVHLAKEKIENGHKVVVYAGALGVPNNIEVLLCAVELFKNQGGSGFHFILIGRGERRKYIEEQVVFRGLSNEITLFEQVPKTIIHQLLSVASFGFISLKPKNIFEYGVSPNKLFDYMLARLPVLYAINSGNSPVSESGCGFSCNADDPQSITDALVAASKMSAEQLKEMGFAGYHFVTHNHDYEVLAEKYEKLFE